jgi:GNAT superfamily N-acetyltransferase
MRSRAALDMSKKYGLFHWLFPGKSPALVENMIEGSSLDSKVYLVHDGGGPVATFTLERLPLSDYYPPGVWTEEASPALYLSSFAVAPAVQGGGLGRAALAMAEDRAAALGAAWLRLDCIREHPRLARFYSLAGFKIRGQPVAQAVRNPARDVCAECGPGSPADGACAPHAPALLHCILFEKKIGTSRNCTGDAIASGKN